MAIDFKVIKNNVYPKRKLKEIVRRRGHSPYIYADSLNYTDLKQLELLICKKGWPYAIISVGGYYEIIIDPNYHLYPFVGAV